MVEVRALTHEICCAASLLMGQAGEGIPVVIVRGLKYEKSCDAREIDLGKAFRVILRENVRVLGLRKILFTLFRLRRRKN